MALIKSISGIRGTIGGRQGESLTPVDLVKYTSAFATWLKNSNTEKKLTVVIGSDARISRNMVRGIVSGTLQGAGINVLDLGMASTPTVEMAVIIEKAAGGIVLTASHNPRQWNALKLLNSSGEFLSAKDGNIVLEIAEKGDFVYADLDHLGKLINDNYTGKHINKILALPLIDAQAIKNRKFKIVVDPVNSVGSKAVAELLSALGVKKLFFINPELTGEFAHNPEPLPENLVKLSKAVVSRKADIGIAVDPDVDRLALVCKNGDMFGEEYTLVAIADYVLRHEKGPTVSNLSSTRALRDITERAGQCYFSSAVGEVNVVEKMKEVGAVIGGEGNGGVIYPALHYGRDALVGIALFLSHLARFKKSCSKLRATYPHYFISKNKIELEAGINVNKILASIIEKYKNLEMNTTDGVKIASGSEWVHLRASNTEPVIRIYSESVSEKKAKELTGKLVEDIREIIGR